MTDRVAMAQEIIERAMAQTVNWKGPCHECRYWQSMHGTDRRYEGKPTAYDVCANDVVRLQAFTPHSGFDVKLKECSETRTPRGPCGPDGWLFEPRNKPIKPTRIVTEPPAKPWYKFW